MNLKLLVLSLIFFGNQIFYAHPFIKKPVEEIALIEKLIIIFKDKKKKEQTTTFHFVTNAQWDRIVANKVETFTNQGKGKWYSRAQWQLTGTTFAVQDYSRSGHFYDRDGVQQTEAQRFFYSLEEEFNKRT